MEKSMSDLISRRKLRESLVCCEGLGRRSLEAVLSAINEQPTIEAVPVVHGEWKRKHIGNGWDDWDSLTCSECGEYYERPNFPTHYCPNCGCRMK